MGIYPLPTYRWFLRSFTRQPRHGWAYRQDLLPADPTAKLEAIPIGKRHPGLLTEKQVEAILDAIPPQNLRNRLLLTLLYETGMRVGEVLDLQVQQEFLLA